VFQHGCPDTSAETCLNRSHFRDLACAKEAAENLIITAKAESSAKNVTFHHSDKIQNGDVPVLAKANPGPPGKWPLKQKE